MSQVIFLNGCGSSGKTCIARGIQHLSAELWLLFGADVFMDMMPPTKEDQYFHFVEGKNERGPTMSLQPMPEGIKLFGSIPEFISFTADQGHNLIVDEMLLGDGLLKKYAHVLSRHTVYFVNVLCDLGQMQEREILRRDRRVGLSNDQIDRVHGGLRSHCDLKVDTTHCSSFEVAAQILTYIQKNPHPKAFETIREGLSQEEKTLGIRL